jgi:Winged helix-turn-helix DNA-binding
MATDVAQAIRARLREIDTELKDFEALRSERERLTRALKELDGAAGPARGTRRRAASNGGRRRGRKRAARGSNQQAILAHIEANPGATTPEIADATGIGRPVVYSAVSRLTSGGTLKKTARDDGQVSYTLTSSR